MIKAEQVPSEAIREAMRVFLWHMNEEETPVEEAWSIFLAAAINAWPGMYDEKDTPWSKASTIHLPLTENSNDT